MQAYCSHPCQDHDVSSFQSACRGKGNPRISWKGLYPPHIPSTTRIGRNTNCKTRTSREAGSHLDSQDSMGPMCLTACATPAFCTHGHYWDLSPIAANSLPCTCIHHVSKSLQPIVKYRSPGRRETDQAKGTTHIFRYSEQL